MTTSTPTQDAQIFDVTDSPPEPEVSAAEPEVIEQPADPQEVATPVDGSPVVPADDPEPEASSSELATVQETAPAEHTVVLDDGWEHERLEFRGDDLAVRKPTKAALSGVVLVSSKYVSMQTQNDVIGLFIARHVGPGSYGHVMSRMMDPDDSDYTDDTVMVLMNQIMNLGRQDAEKADDTAAVKAQ
jgi:hypothetical protein